MDYQPNISYTPRTNPPAEKPATAAVPRPHSLLNFWTGVVIGYWLTTRYNVSITRKVKTNG